MTELYKKAAGAARFLKQRFGDVGKLCIVTGSGLEAILERYTIIDSISYSRIPHLNETTFHKGEFLLLDINGSRACALLGRLHYYEGYSASEVGFPIRIVSLMGVDKIIMTNAAGGLNPRYNAGDIVMLSDHINLLPDNPLRGPNDDRFGMRFPDMSDVYDRKLRQQVNALSEEIDVPIREGIYVSFQGPSLETPAEYRFLNMIGADMVGMSTVPEVIVAIHSGMRVLVFSVISNICYPPEKIKPTTVEDVIAVAMQAVKPLGNLVNAIIERKLMDK